jgi:hypothetical protein
MTAVTRSSTHGRRIGAPSQGSFLTARLKQRHSPSRIVSAICLATRIGRRARIGRIRKSSAGLPSRTSITARRSDPTTAPMIIADLSRCETASLRRAPTITPPQSIATWSTRSMMRHHQTSSQPFLIKESNRVRHIGEFALTNSSRMASAKSQNAKAGRSQTPCTNC